MLLSYKTKVKLNNNYSNIVGHMCYAAFKLWNVCNYERKNFKELGLSKYPDWYYQKKEHKNNLWYKQLPSQTAQEVCKILDKSWKSLEYKLALKGIRFIKVKESYSSQVSPLQPQVSKAYATKNKRITRGLFKDGIYSWNADCVGAYNILRLFFQTHNIEITLNPHFIKVPKVIKVAV